MDHLAQDPLALQTNTAKAESSTAKSGSYISVTTIYLMVLIQARAGVSHMPGGHGPTKEVCKSFSMSASANIVFQTG